MKTILGFLLVTASQSLSWAAELNFFPLFTDHGILQQNAVVPVWGTGTPGASVEVSYGGGKATGVVDSSGKWMVRLQTPKAEEGQVDGISLSVASGNTQKVLKDVVVGEVWLGSGQSNIDTPMKEYAISKDEIGLANHPGIRLYSAAFDAGGGASVTGDFSQYAWNRCVPVIAAKASATGYYFCRELHRALKVPVGFINMAVAGSPLSNWMLPSWIENDPRTAPHYQAFKSSSFPAFIAERKKEVARWQGQCAEEKSKGLPLTQHWHPLQGENPDQPIEKFVGNHHLTHIAATMPFLFKGLLWDHGESGVGYHLTGDYVIYFSIILEHWRKGFGYDLPVVFCEAKGGAWGPTICELDMTNATYPTQKTPKALEDLPQTAPKAGPVFESFEKSSYGWARMNALPGCYMATVRDLQAALHPPDKDKYGLRFFLTALHKVYGKPGEWFGPMMVSAKRDGAQVRLRYQHASGGVVALGGKPPQGFFVADADGKSDWVSARVEGSEIILTGPSLVAAKTVSYAHVSDGLVLWANVFSREGLPAYPMTIRIE